MALRNMSLSDKFSSGWLLASASMRVPVTSLLRMMYLAHTLSLILTIDHQFFLILGVNVGTVRVGDGLYLPIEFIRACIYVAVDVVGIGVGTGAVGAGGWFCKRVVIRSVYCFFIVMNCCCCCCF